MSKQKKMLNDLIEKRVTNWKRHKRKKVFVAFAGVLAVGLGTAGLVYAGTKAKSAFPTPPTDTTVNWSNDSDLAHIVLQDGTYDPLTKLTLGDGTPVYCLGLGVSLADNSTSAQQSAVNSLWAKLGSKPEQQAIINNVAFLSRQAGDDLSYAAGRLAIYQLLDSYGVSTNQAKGIVTEQGDKLQDAGAIIKKANDLILQAQALRQLPSFDNTTVQVVQGVDKVVTDTKGVLSNFPYIQNNLDGVKVSISDNNVTLKAGITSKHGLSTGVLKFLNTQGFLDPDYLPWYIYSTNRDESGTQSQTVMATKDPSNALSILKVNIIGLGEITATKVSANSKFDTKLMVGAEYSFFYKDGSPVKWSDGQSGYAITATSGSKANNTNVVLKVGNDGKFGVKNLRNDKDYYFVETKAPKGFVLDETKHSFSFDKKSSFNIATSNYHVDGESKEIPTGSTTLQKLDADINTTETQGEAKWDGIVYGLFNTKDDSPVKWTDGLKTLPIVITNGTKANDTNVELNLDKDNKVGIQNLNLASIDQYYWKEVRTSEGYSLSTKKIPVNFTGKESVDAITNDFANNQKAQDKVLAFQLRFWKAQSVNASLTGLDGAGFTLTPQNGTKGKAIKAVSKSSTDSDGFTKNGLVIFDGKANLAAGNANADGLAIGDYLLEETDVPKGTQPINPISVTSTSVLNKDGSPKSYKVVLKDTVTGQQISSTTIEADKLTDNNLMFKLDLGTLTDKPIEKVKPTIETQAKTLDDNQVVDLVEVSEKTPLIDTITLTNGELGDKYLGYLHRLVKDKKGEILDDKVVFDKTVILDAEAVENQKLELTAKVDTTKDAKEKAENTVTYVWTGELFDDEQDIKVDAPKAIHDDLSNEKQTLTVEKAPTIKSKAHTKNGDQKIENAEISIKTPVYDDIIFTNVEKGDQMVAKLHRIVTDKDNKVTDSKVIHTINFVIDEFIAKAQETKVQAEIDTTKDKEVSKGSKVTYVWTDELFDEGTNPKTDKPEAKHDDLKNKLQTLTVNYEQPVSPKKVTPPSSSTPFKGIMPKTGAKDNICIAYVGMAVIALALGAGGGYYYKKNKQSKNKKD
ncbi:MAG: hypothetical protein MUW51_00695 [Lactococcus lactis]|nr:hypothetical protein [Lactococcus lactis]